jgi:uncharacterized protein YdhG (YjbR/CyaY superfamily)
MNSVSLRDATHWNGINIGSDVPEDELKRMIEHSYDLIKPKVRKRCMWKCDKCGKEFKTVNQNHYCVKVDSIDDYIAGQSVEIQQILHKVRASIREAAPDAIEKISWQMPTFWQGENLVHFCAHKKHLGIHPGYVERLSDDLRERLAGYKTSKGAIQFPYDKPIDYELIADIARWRVLCVEKPGSEFWFSGKGD